MCPNLMDIIKFSYALWQGIKVLCTSNALESFLFLQSLWKEGIDFLILNENGSETCKIILDISVWTEIQ